MGFCLFNNVAVGAAHAMEAHGLERVAIVDFDVHHGNGTEDIFQGDMRVLMVSTFQHPLYPYCGARQSGAQHGQRAAVGGLGQRRVPRGGGRPLAAGARDAQAGDHPDLGRASTPIARIPLAGLKLTEADYTWVTHELVEVAAKHSKRRIVSTLEGGYALSALGRSAAEHVRVLVEA